MAGVDDLNLDLDYSGFSMPDDTYTNILDDTYTSIPDVSGNPDTAPPAASTPFDWGGLVSALSTLGTTAVSIFGVANKTATVVTNAQTGTTVTTGSTTAPTGYLYNSANIPAGYVYNPDTNQYVNPSTGAIFPANGTASTSGIDTPTLLLIGGGVLAAVIIIKLVSK